MSLADIVQLTISTAGPSITRAGFGTPMILAYHEEFPERIRYYSDADELAEDFTSTHPVYRAGNAMFSQSPRSTRIAVGRRENAPTQSVTITPTVQAGATYVVTIDGTAFDYTEDGDDDEEDIVDALLAKINGASLGITASRDGDSSASKLKLVADAAGDWFAIKVGALLSIATDNADPGVADDLTAIQEENDDWFAVYPISRSAAEIAAIAGWVESRRKMLVVDSNDSDLKTSVTTDIGSTLKTAARFNSSVWFHADPGEFIGAALLAAVLPLDPGSETWAYKTLRGVSADALTSTERTNLLGKNVGIYVSIAGRNVTREGKVASGEWIDKVRGIHWLDARISEDLFELISNRPTKVPYTNAGAEGVRATIQARLENGIETGFLAAEPAPTTEVPDVATIPESVKRQRKLPNVKFFATVAGAIHTIEIQGSIAD